MLTSEQAQALLFVVDNRDIAHSSLNEETANLIDQLEARRMVKVTNGKVSAEPHALKLVEVYKSGLNFDTLYRRMSFKSTTKLMHKGFEKCFSEGVHLNVIFRNMSQEHLDILKQEIKIAEEARSTISLTVNKKDYDTSTSNQQPDSSNSNFSSSNG